MAYRSWIDRLSAAPLGASFMTPAALEDLAENMTQRVAPDDMPYVSAALARRLAEAMRTIADLEEENKALRGGHAG